MKKDIESIIPFRFIDNITLTEWTTSCTSMLCKHPDRTDCDVEWRQRNKGIFPLVTMVYRKWIIFILFEIKTWLWTANLSCLNAPVVRTNNSGYVILSVLRPIREGCLMPDVWIHNFDTSRSQSLSSESRISSLLFSPSFATGIFWKYKIMVNTKKTRLSGWWLTMYQYTLLAIFWSPWVHAISFIMNTLMSLRYNKWLFFYISG